MCKILVFSIFPEYLYSNISLINDFCKVLIFLAKPGSLKKK